MGSDLEDFAKEYGDQGDVENAEPSSQGHGVFARGSRSPQRYEIWVTRTDPPGDLPTRGSLEPELLVGTPSSLRLLVPSRGEYALLYGAVGVLGSLLFLVFWFVGALPFASPLGPPGSHGPGQGSGILLVTLFGGILIFAVMAFLYQFRVRHRPKASRAVTVSEFLPKRDRVFLHVSVGDDTFWLSATCPSGYKTSKLWERHVRAVLALANQSPPDGGDPSLLR